eukprot:351357-Chlamydomonas_euryale.AAC.8
MTEFYIVLGARPRTAAPRGSAPYQSDSDSDGTTALICIAPAGKIRSNDTFTHQAFYEENSQVGSHLTCSGSESPNQATGQNIHQVCKLPFQTGASAGSR